MRIPGIDEELELVTSFDELKVGVSFWVLLCFCGGRHRGMVTRLVVEATMDGVTMDGQLFGHRGKVAHFAPAVTHPIPLRGHLIRIIVNEMSVTSQTVYRVVDPLMDHGDVNDERRRWLEHEEVTAVRDSVKLP